MTYRFATNIRNFPMRAIQGPSLMPAEAQRRRQGSYCGGNKEALGGLPGFRQRNRVS